MIIEREEVQWMKLEDAVYEQVERPQLQFLIFICLPIVSSWSVNVAEPEIQLWPSYYTYTYALAGYVWIVTSLHALSTDADAPEMQHFEHAICIGNCWRNVWQDWNSIWFWKFENPTWLGTYSYYRIIIITEVHFFVFGWDENRIKLHCQDFQEQDKTPTHLEYNKEEEEPQEEYPGHLPQMLYKSGQQSSICHNQDNDDNIPPLLAAH